MNFNSPKLLLSICIPTYNRGKYLKSNLCSIYNQSFNDLLVEIIVSNNNSTDNTKEVINAAIINLVISSVFYLGLPNLCQLLIFPNYFA